MDERSYEELSQCFPLISSSAQPSKEEHVTRIPINQTKSKLLDSPEGKLISNNFGTDCLDSDISNVTVNGVYFSQKFISDASVSANQRTVQITHAWENQPLKFPRIFDVNF